MDAFRSLADDPDRLDVIRVLPAGYNTRSYQDTRAEEGGAA